MTAADLIDLFLATLVRERGGTRRQWRIAIGDVRVHSVDTHPHCNWSVQPTGGAGATEAIERVADDLRARYPIVR